MDDEKMTMEGGIPHIKVSTALAKKYPDFIRACVDLNGKLLMEGTAREAEELVKIGGSIIAFAYSVLKAAEAVDCVNDTPA
ncbi:MAG: hypothetical protein BWX71_00733 [Deltaproteobacteria bacterium ADurb.Bin072]|nr:MAG: hypothetical protein BWX71_00733 [Deltaproteobacteria bacterium ADurb.Bin072]